MKQLFLIAAVIFSMSVNAQTKSGSQEVRKTESKEAEKMDTTYVLRGDFPDFQLLYRAVKSPGDITPNQMSALAAWIEKVQMVQLPRKKN